MRGLAIAALLMLTASIANAEAFGQPQGIAPVSRGGTGQTSANYAASLPSGLATLFVFNVAQMRQVQGLVDSPQTISAAFSAGTTPTAIVGATGGNTNPQIVSRTWQAGILESPANPGTCAQFSTLTDPGITAIVTNGKFEMMVLTRQHGEPTNHDVIMNTSLGADGPGFRLTDSGTNNNYIWSTSNGAATTNTLTLGAGATRAIRRKWHVIDVNGDGSNQTMNLYTLGGTVSATVGPTANSPSQSGVPTHPVTIGANYACANAADRIIGGVAIWARVLTSSERATAVATLYRLAEIDPNSDQRVIALFGDSVLAGTGSGAQPAVWEYLQAYLPNYRITMRAVSGTTTSTIATSVTDELTVETPLLGVVQGGVNDITAAVADATIYSNLTGMCSSLKAATSKCVLMNIAPGNSGNQTVHTPIVNTSIAGTSVPSTADALFDANALLKDPAGTAVQWNTVYQFDTLHPNGVGNREIAKGLADQITALIGS